MAFTKDGQDYVALPAETKSVKEMAGLGYKPQQIWEAEAEIAKNPSYKPSATVSFLSSLADELSLGAGKYASAAVSSLLPGGSSFAKELEAEEYARRREKESSPVASTMGSLTGGVATGIATGGASGLLRAGAPAVTTTGRVAMGAAGEALPEVIKGTLQSEKEDLTGKLGEGAVSGLIGAATGGLGGALTKPARTAEALGQAARVGTYAVKEAASPTAALPFALDPSLDAFVAAVKGVPALITGTNDLMKYKSVS